MASSPIKINSYYNPSKKQFTDKQLGNSGFKLQVNYKSEKERIVKLTVKKERFCRRKVRKESTS